MKISLGGFIGNMPSSQTDLEKLATNDNLVNWIRSVRPGMFPGLKTDSDPVVNVLWNGMRHPGMEQMMNDEIAPSTRACLQNMQKSAAEKYACLMLHPDATTTASLVKFFKSFIDKDDVYDNAAHEYGIESQPHVTILFGIHSDSAQHSLKHFADHRPVYSFIKNVSLFETPNYDVVKFGISGGRLEAMNVKIRDAVEYTSTHPEYQPHMTIAYCKPGTGKKYLKKTVWDGRRLVGTRLRFSSSDDSETRWLALTDNVKHASDMTVLEKMAVDYAY